MNPSIIFKSIAGLVAVILLAGTFFTVSPGYRGVLVRMGSVQETTYEEGIHFKLPLIESANEINVQTLTFKAKDIDAGTRDLQTVNTSLAVQAEISPAMVREVYRNYRDVETLETRVIDPSIAEVIKAVTAKYDAAELITKRTVVRDEILTLLRAKLTQHFITVKDVSITNFAFSKGFNEAVEAKVTAEQKAQKAVNDLKRIETEAQQKVVAAKGEAEAIRVQAQAIQSQGGAEYVQLQAIAKWDGKLPTYTGGNNVPMINLGK